MPTDIEKTKFEPGLNIFGILRVDGKNYGTSFIRVERAYLLNEIVQENAVFVPTIDSAHVQIIHDGKDTIQFLFKYDGTYDNVNYIPKSGQPYSIVIDNTEFPVLRGSTIIPKTPIVNTVIRNSEELSVVVIPDSTIHLFEIYPIYGTGVIHAKRFTNDANKHVELTVPNRDEKLGPLNRIEVFSYDKNMSDYLQATITIKPQSYNEMVKTVEGGYGVFGSVVRSVVYLR